jgi:hypothetical protein
VPIQFDVDNRTVMPVKLDIFKMLTSFHEKFKDYLNHTSHSAQSSLRLVYGVAEWYTQRVVRHF